MAQISASFKDLEIIDVVSIMLSFNYQFCGLQMWTVSGR